MACGYIGSIGSWYLHVSAEQLLMLKPLMHKIKPSALWLDFKQQLFETYFVK